MTINQTNDSTSFQAIVTALNSCMYVLKNIIILMVIIFIFSGIFWVQEGTLAIRIRWGKICEFDDKSIILPGGPYFAFPDPIEKHIVIPTTIQSITLKNSFWYSNQDKNQTLVKYLPNSHGTILTGDKNIVYGKWVISFSVEFNKETIDGLKKPLLFFKNVGTIDRAKDLVTLSAERAIVHVTAQTSIDDFVKGKENHQIIKTKIQNILNNLNTGIKIHSVSQKSYGVSHHLNYEFQSVNRAESQKALKIEEAKRFKSMILTQTAGNNYENIIQIIKKIGQTDDLKKKSQLEKQLIKYYLSDSLGGLAFEIINEAKIYKTKTLDNIQAAAKRFEKLLNQEKNNSRILRHRMLQDCIENIFSQKIQTIVLPKSNTKQLYLDLGGYN